MAVTQSKHSTDNIRVGVCAYYDSMSCALQKEKDNTFLIILQIRIVQDYKSFFVIYACYFFVYNSHTILWIFLVAPGIYFCNDA